MNERGFVSRLGGIFIFLAAALVLLATLYPTEATGGASSYECVLCGERAIADALVNVILFLPLGAALALPGRRLVVALALGAALSCGVEIAQISLIPGRDASPVDFVFNTLGAAIGVAIIRTSRWWMGQDCTHASRLSLAAAFATLAVVTGTGLLLTPHLPAARYAVMWNPVLRHLEPYDGTVLSATIDGEPLPARRIENTARIRQQLSTNVTLRVDAISAAARSRQAAMLAIYDEFKREVMLIGPDRHDLVFRLRTRSASWWLDQPSIRIVDGWRSVVPGSSIMVTARRAGRAYCVGFGPEPPCSSGFTAGMGWTILQRMERLPALVRSSLNALWLAILGAAVGFWFRMRWESFAALAVFAAAIAVVPRYVGLLPTPMAQLFGAFTGLALGVLMAGGVADLPNTRHHVVQDPQ